MVTCVTYMYMKHVPGCPTGGGLSTQWQQFHFRSTWQLSLSSKSLWWHIHPSGPKRKKFQRCGHTALWPLGMPGSSKQWPIIVVPGRCTVPWEAQMPFGGNSSFKSWIPREMLSYKYQETLWSFGRFEGQTGKLDETFYLNIDRWVC